MNTNNNFSPKDFMKKRRPGQFSDSFVVEESKLDSLTLEMVLANLSTKQQEFDFEEFARKLCQYEIQPNLRPQTGPAAGGDGKVDTETTPVSQEIRDIYYFGEEQKSEERWGFAFSTIEEKNLNGKIRKDVQKMMGTGRPYTKIFFLTNRFLKAGKRAALEDELSQEYNVPVTIHDGNWISKKVFDNKRESLAIEELKIDPSYKENKKIGFNDMSRKESFDLLNKEIEEAVQEKRVNFAIVEKALSAALFAAEMEMPKVEVEGLFTRAIRLAKKHGSSEQYFTARYQEVWTMYFWYEDSDILLENYEEIESLTENTTNLFSIERLSNLLSILKSIAVTTDIVEVEYANNKKLVVVKKLEAFKLDESRPSAALHAEFMLNVIEIPDSKGDEDSMNKIFKDLIDIVNKSQGLLGFPLEAMYKMTQELNDFYNGNEVFEELQDTFMKVVSERKSSTEMAQILMNRSLQHIDGKRYYKAIDCLGRSIVPLYKEEVKDDLVIVLTHLSFAYQSVGLLWAARSALLHAASYATMDFQKNGEINKLQLLLYNRMRSIELLLGRVGYSLEWHNLSNLMNQQFIKSNEEIKELINGNLLYGCLLGCLLIKTKDENLSQVEYLPDTLISMDLDFAAYAIIYRLQGEEALPDSFVESVEGNDIQAFFNSYLDQPAQSDLPDYADFYIDEYVTLKSTILGTEFVVKAQNTIPVIEIGEYLLSSLEAFLATTVDMDSFGNVSTLNMNIIKNDSLGVGVEFEVDDKGAVTFNITCGDFNPQALKKSQQEKLYSDISNLTLTIVGYSISFRDADMNLKQLFQDEEVGVRAFSFSSPMVVQGNVIGHRPKKSILDWKNTNDHLFKHDPEKSGHLDFNQILKTKKTNSENGPQKHTDMRNTSIIQNHLWDEAGWSGTLYLTIPDKPPVLAIMFSNEEKAKAIFKDWKKLVGDSDTENEIRISLIKGYTNKNPLWYKILISRNMDNIVNDEILVMNAGRTNVMQARSTSNLDRFQDSFNEWGYYLFVPAFVEDPTKPKIEEIIFDHGIIKNDLVVQDAWKIGPNQQDILAIKSSDTNPVIPEEIKNPPILETLDKLME